MLPDRFLIVRRDFPRRGLADVAGATRAELDASGLAERAARGARIGIGVGSRGIANVATVVRGVVQYWRDHGAAPFVFPAMGSHGAATAEGQADVLAHLGVTAQSVGCPIVGRPEVVSLGRTVDGIEVFMDAAAHAADAVMIVARVKWHTTFSGAVESGLMKMLAIGLGKFAGAQRYHSHAQRLGLEHVIRTAGRIVLQSGRIAGAVAIVEDAYHDTARIEVVPVERIEERDVENLALAKSWMPRLPCDLDVLIVDEMGKNISGTGMDAKVVNRGPSCEYNPYDELPRVTRIFVRGLHPDSYGNALGIGMADVTTDRLVRAIDWAPTRVNALSSGIPSKIRVPTHFGSDRECLDWVAATAGHMDSTEVTYGWIKNTLELGQVAVSANLRGKVDGIIEREVAVEWDRDGNLVSAL